MLFEPTNKDPYESLTQNHLQPYRLYGVKKNILANRSIFCIYHLKLPTHRHNYAIKSVMVHRQESLLRVKFNSHQQHHFFDLGVGVSSSDIITLSNVKIDFKICNAIVDPYILVPQKCIKCHRHYNYTIIQGTTLHINHHNTMQTLINQQ